MQVTITTDYKKNKKLMTDFHRVVGTALRRRKVIAQRIFYGIFGLLGIFSGISLLLIATDSTKYSVAALGLLFGAYFFIRAAFYYQWLGFFSGRMLVKEVSTVQYTFKEDKVVIDNALEHCEHPYHVFTGLYEARRIFVLMVTPRVGYVIEKAAFSEEALAQFRTLMAEKFEVPLVQYDI